jgi:hypothetical protein
MSAPAQSGHGGTLTQCVAAIFEPDNLKPSKTLRWSRGDTIRLSEARGGRNCVRRPRINYPAANVA